MLQCFLYRRLTPRQSRRLLHLALQDAEGAQGRSQGNRAEPGLSPRVHTCREVLLPPGGRGERAEVLREGSGAGATAAGRADAIRRVRVDAEGGGNGKRGSEIGPNCGNADGEHRFLLRVIGERAENNTDTSVDKGPLSQLEGAVHPAGALLPARERHHQRANRPESRHSQYRPVFVIQLLPVPVRRLRVGRREAGSVQQRREWRGRGARQPVGETPRDGGKCESLHATDSPLRDGAALPRRPTLHAPHPALPLPRRMEGRCEGATVSVDDLRRGGAAVPEQAVRRLPCETRGLSGDASELRCEERVQLGGGAARGRAAVLSVSGERAVRPPGDRLQDDQGEVPSLQRAVQRGDQ